MGGAAPLSVAPLGLATVQAGGAATVAGGGAAKARSRVVPLAASSATDPPAGGYARIGASSAGPSTAASQSAGGVPGAMLGQAAMRPNGADGEVEDDYCISEKEESSDDEDSDEEKERRAKKPIPNWARGKQLESQLHAQYGGQERVDPDRIFSEVQSCELDRVFEQSRSRHRPRGSTGNWLPDRLTDRERK